MLQAYFYTIHTYCIFMCMCMCVNLHCRQLCHVKLSNNMQYAEIAISSDLVVFNQMITKEKNLYTSLQRVIEVAMFFRTFTLNYP